MADRVEDKGASAPQPRLRRVGSLVVVAAPAGAGKSTLMRALRQGRLPEVAQRLQIDNPADWPDTVAVNLARKKDSTYVRLLLHYDLVAQLLFERDARSRNISVDPFEIADRVGVLTIWCEPDVLRRQHAAAKLTETAKNPKHRPRSYYVQVNEFYADPAKVVALYRKWFDHVQSKTAEHCIVSFTDRVRFFSREEWEEEARRCEGARS